MAMPTAKIGNFNKNYTRNKYKAQLLPEITVESAASAGNHLSGKLGNFILALLDIGEVSWMLL